MSDDKLEPSFEAWLRPMSKSPSVGSFARRAIGLIAAYAIALQAILGGVLPIRVAFGDAVICHGADGIEGLDKNPGQTPHDGQSGHCGLCAISPPIMPRLADLSRPVLHPTSLAVAEPTAINLPRDIRSHPGKPRDPPAAA